MLVELDAGALVLLEVDVEVDVASVEGELVGFCCNSVWVAVIGDAALLPWTAKGLTNEAIFPSSSMPSKLHLLPVVSESGIQVYALVVRLAAIGIYDCTESPG